MEKNDIVKALLSKDIEVRKLAGNFLITNFDTHIYVYYNWIYLEDIQEHRITKISYHISYWLVQRLANTLILDIIKDNKYYTTPAIEELINIIYKYGRKHK